MANQMSKTVHQLKQGSPEWHAHRATPNQFNASEVAAMMGLDPNTSRSEMLRMKASGGEKEFSEWVRKNVLDKGHEHEAAARPLAQMYIEGETDEQDCTLHALNITRVVDGLRFSCSYDGILNSHHITWEHKSLNQELAAALDAGYLPERYHPQCEVGLMNADADACLFMASENGDPATARYFWYLPNFEFRARLLAECRQFQIDLDNYVPREEAPKVVAAPVLDLPAVIVNASGQITITDNFEIFGARLRKFVDEELIREPVTDQDFANLEAQVKTLTKAEDALNRAEENVLNQMVAVSEMRRLKEMYHALARDNRLMAERIIKDRKEKRRLEIINDGKKALTDHVAALNASIGYQYVALPAIDFAGAVKGKRSFALMMDAVADRVKDGKILADQQANLMRANLALLDKVDAKYTTLFNDIAQLITKTSDDLQATITARIADQEQKEQQQRERIREEERQKLEQEQRNAEAKAAAAAAVSQVNVKPVAGGSESSGALYSNSQPLNLSRQPAPAATGVELGVRTPDYSKPEEIRELGHAEYVIAHRRESGAIAINLGGFVKTVSDADALDLCRRLKGLLGLQIV